MTLSKGTYNAAEWEGTPPPQHVEHSNIFNTIRNVTNFASLMRVCGAVIMLAAMSSYLMKGWSDGNDISRYYMLLSQTFLLALSGFGLSYLLKENKGARIFFGLGLISITVNMTTLGALVFSMTQWGSELVPYPSFAEWIAPDSSEIMMALFTTLLLSAPVIWIGHKVLARRSALLVSCLFLFTNILLLIPVRESAFVGAIALIAILVPLAFLCNRMTNDNTLRTPEGLFAMATVFIPAGIIICRSILLYLVDEILQITLAGTAFIALRFCAQQTEESSLARGITNWLSFFAALGVAMPATVLSQLYLPGEFALNVFGIVLAGLLWDMSRRCQKPVATMRMAALILIMSHIFPVIFIDDIANAILCIFAGLAVIAISRQYGLHNMMIMGVLTFLAGSARQVIEVVEMIDFSNWITLSICGATIIIAASLIERHGALIKMKWDRFSKPAE